MGSIRPFFVLAAIAPLAGCADLGAGGVRAPFVTAAVPASLAVEVGADQALARLPGEAGAVVSVTERREGDRLTQVVALAGDGVGRGTNRIRVVAANHDAGRSRRPTEEAIAAELAAELPDVAMQPVAQVITGPGGPIGMATGRTAGGETCVYAWQESDVRASGARGGMFGGDTVDLSVRVRLCRRDLDEGRAVALVEGLRLRGDVVTLGRRTAAGPTGVDALASAGYGAPVSRTLAVEPGRPAVASPRLAGSEAKATVPRRSEKPPAASAAVPLPDAARNASPTPATSEPGPSAAVPTIPLPNGG